MLGGQQDRKPWIWRTLDEYCPTHGGPGYRSVHGFPASIAFAAQIKEAFTVSSLVAINGLTL